LTTIRRREETDWPQLLDLWVASWLATFPRIDFNARRSWLTQHIAELEKNGAITLCLTRQPNKEIAGFVVINPTTGWLDQICVGPQYFGQGYGEDLLNIAKKNSPQLILLDVNADNYRAIRFYERNDFVQVGEGANTLSGRPTIMLEWRHS